MIDALVATAIVAAASCLQGIVGFGANLVASPLLLLVADQYVPGPIILASAVLNVLVARREESTAVDERIQAAIVGQVSGAVVAGAVLSALPASRLSVLFAATVLVAVALSASGLHLEPRRSTLVGAGVASGFMGTVSGIGGPPIALVYQRASGAALRATLARYFLVGTFVSIPTLVVVGVLGVRELGLALVLLPATAGGFILSRRFLHRIDSTSVRPFVLGLSTVAALAVLVRELA